jgi:hypothetical protein
MEPNTEQPKPDEFTISMTRYEITLVSNLVFIAANHVPLDDYSRKAAINCMLKMQKAALQLHRQPSSQPAR